MSSQDKSKYWFAKVDIDVLGDKELSPMTKYIFVVLCKFADEDTRECWPSNEAIADFAGVAKITVIRACKELATRGIISREARFKNNQQTSSYTLIAGHNAPCYGGISRDMAGVSPEIHGTRTNEQEKDSLTGEAPLPEPPIPEETHTSDEAPEVMKSTADLLLLKTGRKALTWEEISALRTLSATQYPSRVQKEIDRAITRFTRKGRPLHTLTFMYIAGALAHQPSLGRKRKLKPQPQHVPVCTDEEADAMMAEIEAMRAEFDREAGR